MPRWTDWRNETAYFLAWEMTESDEAAAKLLHVTVDYFRHRRSNMALSPKPQSRGSDLSTLLRKELRDKTEHLNVLMGRAEKFLETGSGTDRAMLVECLERLRNGQS